MSFLLDTDTCSAHLKRPAGLMHRFTQHSGALYIPSIVLAELHAWAYRRQDATPVIERIENDLLADVAVLDFDANCAKEFGRNRGQDLNEGESIPSLALRASGRTYLHDFCHLEIRPLVLG